MKFYCAPNTIAVATAVLLEETGLEYEPVILNFATGEQAKPKYQAINPKGRVPAIVTDHGILTETGAIAEYLAGLVPDKALVPSDPWAAAQMRAVMYYLASTFHVNHAHNRRGSRWAEQRKLVSGHDRESAGNHGRILCLHRRDLRAVPLRHGRDHDRGRPVAFHHLHLAARRRRRHHRLPQTLEPSLT